MPGNADSVNMLSNVFDPEPDTNETWTTDPTKVTLYARRVERSLGVRVETMANGVRVLDARSGTMAEAYPCTDGSWLVLVWNVTDATPGHLSATTDTDPQWDAFALGAEVVRSERATRPDARSVIRNVSASGWRRAAANPAMNVLDRILDIARYER